jgi:hypothetical protein
LAWLGGDFFGGASEGEAMLNPYGNPHVDEVKMVLPDLDPLHPGLTEEIGENLDLCWIKTQLQITTAEFEYLRRTLRRAMWTVGVFVVVNAVLTLILAAMVFAMQTAQTPPT